MCDRIVGPVRNTNLVSSDASATYVALTDFMPAIGFQTVRGLLELIAKSGTFSVAVAYQTADTDPTSPNAWAALESTPEWLSAQGDKDCTDDVTLDTGGTFWIRFGLAIKNSTGTSLTRGDVQLTIAAIT